MEEKEKIIRQQRRKLESYQRCRKFLYFFLFIQFLIFWICNPEFIPGVSQWVAEVRAFFEGLLWPRDMAELDAGTYRAYIYQFCTWLEGLEFYPLLKWMAPRLVPAWLVVTVIQSCIARFRIRKATNPPKEKKQRKPKKSEEPARTGSIVGPRVSGLYPSKRKATEKRFEALQERCETLQECSGNLQADRGLWVSNQLRGTTGVSSADQHYPWDNNGARGGNPQRRSASKGLSDRIYSWDDRGKIEIPYKDDVLHFELYDEGPRMWIQDTDPVCLKKGIPLTITHNNEAGNEIVGMTITWLGGIK